MEKSGMIFEGVLRKARLNNQGIVDVAIYSILRSDHFKNKYFFLERGRFLLFLFFTKIAESSESPQPHTFRYPVPFGTRDAQPFLPPENLRY